jgi:hypothetical protein
MTMSDAKEKGSEPVPQSQPSEMPKYTYQAMDSRTYSVDYRDPAKSAALDEPILSLRNLNL